MVAGLINPGPGDECRVGIAEILERIGNLLVDGTEFEIRGVDLQEIYE